LREFGTKNNPRCIRIIRRCHFDDESFVHHLHSVRFDPDHPYEIPIEALMADQPLSSSENGKSFTRRSRSSRRPVPHYSPKGMSSTQRVPSCSSTKGTSSSRCRVASKTLRIWSVIRSILLSVVVTLQYRIRPRMHQTDGLTITTLRVMIFLEFGNRHRWVRVYVSVGR
ncbi:hypothetical protein PIB30_011834, partial [Stylosanthes scabra]|nr:hypothetical protein [Stylosanthes scabra]